MGADITQSRMYRIIYCEVNYGTEVQKEKSITYTYTAINM